MADKIVVIDFAGTLVKAEVIDEANEFRTGILKRGVPSTADHAEPELFYRANREFVEKLTGISEGMTLRYRKNDLGFMDISGVQVQNQIATNLFQIGMYMAAKKHRRHIIPNGLVEQLQRMKQVGYKLAIVSGVRTDIISGMLQIAKFPVEFDFIFGQPPVLGTENQEGDVKELEAEGDIVFNIGDKLSDLERVPGAKKVFVRWGHPAGGEESVADFSISRPDELENIIK